MPLAEPLVRFFWGLCVLCWRRYQWLPRHIPLAFRLKIQAEAALTRRHFDRSQKSTIRLNNKYHLRGEPAVYIWNSAGPTRFAGLFKSFHQLLSCFSSEAPARKKFSLPSPPRAEKERPYFWERELRQPEQWFWRPLLLLQISSRCFLLVGRFWQLWFWLKPEMKQGKLPDDEKKNEKQENYFSQKVVLDHESILYDKKDTTRKVLGYWELIRKRLKIRSNKL